MSARVQSIIKPLRPNLQHWRGPFKTVASQNYPAELWMYSDRAVTLSVISAVEVAKDDDGVDRGPEYHVSIAQQTRGGTMRCDSVTASWALEQFGLVGSEEDNHVKSGVVRNFWRAVAEPLIGLECGCKATEPRVIENKGDFVSRPA